MNTEPLWDATRDCLVVIVVNKRSILGNQVTKEVRRHVLVHSSDLVNVKTTVRLHALLPYHDLFWKHG